MTKSRSGAKPSEPLGSERLSAAKRPVPKEQKRYIHFIALIEADLELKKRKKLEPTSIALPADSASSIAFDDVIPLLPSAAGQSLWCMISTGLTSHQIAPVLTRELSTTWL